jgi:hypothetical protein
MRDARMGRNSPEELGTGPQGLRDDRSPTEEDYDPISLNDGRPPRRPVAVWPEKPNWDAAGTCDWGWCEDEAVYWRFDLDTNWWLPVCAGHAPICAIPDCGCEGAAHA